MKYFRYALMIDDGPIEDNWYCENCINEVPENFDYLDQDNDEYGSHVCENCGYCFDDEIDEAWEDM